MQPRNKHHMRKAATSEAKALVCPRRQRRVASVCIGWRLSETADPSTARPTASRGRRDRSASPDFLSRVAGFGQLHVVLFRENHISGVAESCEVGNPGTLGACDFFDLACSLWLESWEEHLPTSIAGVLRLRAISRPLCDRAARRFAQDDGFVGGEKHPVSYAENTKRSKKSQARDDKG